MEDLYAADVKSQSRDILRSCDDDYFNENALPPSGNSLLHTSLTSVSNPWSISARNN